MSDEEFNQIAWARRGKVGGSAFTWIRTHRCAASCCPVGFAAAFCTCLGPVLRSRRAAHRSASSWSRLGRRLALSLKSGQEKRGTQVETKKTKRQTNRNTMKQT
ncbi:hypothetical protein ILYODFUR_025849 [Ilyodon furcidens]|uniref:Uncharacterized protein n=1 Tax=Ilyodon furcidens TaxID=33524 RepID=A0ABV0SRJ0_9TELE